MIFSVEDEELLRTYKRIRNVQKALNADLVSRLPKNTVLESAKRLGLTRGKAMIFNSVHESTVLFDYCLYSARTGGKTPVEWYAAKTPPPPDSDEMTVFRAMLDSYFFIFTVRRVYKGRGISLYNLQKDKEILLMDIGFGETAVPNMLLAGRILSFQDFHMSAGAFLPLSDKPVMDAVMPIVDKWLLDHPEWGRTKPSPGLEANVSAQIIRAALRAGAMDSVEYQEMTEAVRNKKRPPID